MRKTLSSFRLSDKVKVGDLLTIERYDKTIAALVLEVKETKYVAAYGDKQRKEFKVLEAGKEIWYADIELSALFKKP
jgi:ribosomal 50S subunit-recycling heat shock protein